VFPNIGVVLDVVVGLNIIFDEFVFVFVFGKNVFGFVFVEVVGVVAKKEFDVGVLVFPNILK
jgi:hypothetical protein